MKNEEFATAAVILRRAVLTVLLLFGAVANSSFFILHSSFFVVPAGAQAQTGKASYYAKRATGSRTANGEKLHHDSLTCAHRTYPFGTLLHVKNPANDQEVVVRVNDRGPFVRGRIIDLSWGAAKALGILAQGIATVVVEPLVEFRIPMRSEEVLELPKIAEAMETEEFPWRPINGEYFE